MKTLILLLSLPFALLSQTTPTSNDTGNSKNGIAKLGTGAANFKVAPRLFTIEDGSPSSYVTAVTQYTPTANVTLWNGTPQSKAEYGAYAQRIDLITKPNTDVQSSVALGVVATAHSSNSGGAPTYFNTTQVGILANASAVDATASTSVAGINAIAGTAYTGRVPQHVIGFESDVLPNRDGTAEGGSTGAWVIGGLFTNNSISRSTTDGTIGVLVRGVDTNDSWKIASYLSGRYVGLATGPSLGLIPDAGYWARNSKQWGIYVGSRNIEPSAPFNVDMTLGNPAVGIELGERGSTSAPSNKLRFSGRNAAGAQQIWDFSTDLNGIFSFAFNDSNRLTIAPSGDTSISGTLTNKGAIAANGGATIGGGSTINKVVLAQGVFPRSAYTAIASGDCEERVFIVDGAKTTGAAYGGPTAALGAGLSWSLWIAETSEVNVRICNVTNASILPSAVSWNIGVME